MSTLVDFRKHRGALLRQTPEERFWFQVSFIDKSGDCWEWPGARNSFGYGLVKVLVGEVEHTRTASRRMWELTNGPIPPGMLVCHKCDNPPCVNPAHLFLGTGRENVHDAQQKGRFRRRVISPKKRMPCGENHSAAKLTDAVVKEMRGVFDAGASSIQGLATKYGVHLTTASKAVNRKTWRHID